MFSLLFHVSFLRDSTCHYYLDPEQIYQLKVYRLCTALDDPPTDPAPPAPIRYISRDIRHHCFPHALGAHSIAAVWPAQVPALLHR